MSGATAAAASTPRPSVTLRVQCSRCGRLQTRRGSIGLYWRCKYEGCTDEDGKQSLNPGPKLLATMGRQPEVRRRKRRAPAAAGPAEGNASPPGPPAAAAAASPARRRTKRAAPAASSPAAAPAAAPAPPAPAATPETTPARSSWGRRWLIGEEDA